MRVPERLIQATLCAVLAAPLSGLAAERAPALIRGVDLTQGEEEQIRQREEWFIRSRGLDQVARPDLLRAQAVAELAEARRQREDLLRLRGEVWSPIGPETMTMLSWVMGPVAGRAISLAVHPTDENILYLATASGGLWKTTNGGGSWTSLFDDIGTLSVGTVVLDPGNPEVVWAGTGERQSSCANYFGLGLYRSDDGGATFEARNGAAPNTLDLSFIVSIAVQPGSPQTLLVSGDAFCLPDGTRVPGGVFRTTNGGTSWTRVLAGTGSDVIYDPNNAQVAYATMSGDAVYKSFDGGATWGQYSAGVPIIPSPRMRLVMSRSDSQVLYLLTSGSRLYRTNNGGTNWVLVNSGACEGQCTYNLCLDVHPTDPNIVVVGTIRHFKSTNGGATLNVLTSTWGSGQTVHQDTHIVRFSRTNGLRFWVGGDGGLWRADDGGGGTYANLNSNLILTQFYDVGLDPNDPTTVFGGAQDNSSSRRFNGLQQLNVTVVTGDGFVNVVDPVTSTQVFQTSYPNNGPSVYRSQNGGAPNTFSRLATNGAVGGEPWPWVTPLAIKPGMIFVGSHSVYRGATSQSTGGFTWTKIGDNLTGGPSIVVLATNPVNPSATDMWMGGSNGRIQRTDDVLATPVTWSDVTGDFPASYVSDIAADPFVAGRVYATRGAFGLSRLYRSTTNGTAWTGVGTGLPNVPANAVAVDPITPNRVFVGTDVGVYESMDGGDTFAPFASGMPLGTVVTDLEIDNSPHVLVAGTYGRGAFLVNLLSTPAEGDAAAASR
ncbi:MAG TPA: hypothetical protein VFO85_12450 [Vicinamibacteria bacterium]|nr:hypothetical protein [Vicinamibacteria bacterium]